MSNSILNNILLCCPVYEPHAGGGGQYFPLLAKHFLSFEKVKEVIVLSEYNKECKLLTKSGNLTIYRILPQRDTMSNKNIIYYIVSFFLTYFIFYSFIPYLIIFKKIKVIHYTRYLRKAFYFLTFLMSKIFKIKIVLDMRTTVENTKFIKNIFGFDLMICNSQAVYNQMSLLGIESRKVLVPNPINFPKKIDYNECIPVVKKYLGKNFNPFLLFVGQLLERKSIFEILDAFKCFHKKNPNVNLVVIGRNMIGKKIYNKINSLKGVIYLDSLPRDLVIKFMIISELVLQPSKFEGIPRVTLEALFLEKKVLLPPCVPEFKNLNPVFQIKECSVNEIKKAMQRILKTTEKCNYNLKIHLPKNIQLILEKIYNKCIW